MKISTLENKILRFAYNYYDAKGNPDFEMNTAFFSGKFSASPQKVSQALLNLHEMEYILAGSRGFEDMDIHTLTTKGKRYCKEREFNINEFLKHPLLSAVISALVSATVAGLITYFSSPAPK